MTEGDHLERILELWARYRFHVLAGLAMLLALIAGFTYRHSSHETAQQQANEALYALLDAGDNNNAETADAAYAELREIGEFPELARFGEFVIASLRLDAGDREAAQAALQTAIDETDDAGVRRLAALRLAEILVNAGDYEDAESLLGKHMPGDGRLRILFSERIGDAKFAAGDQAGAEEAYLQAATLASDGAGFYLPLLRIKIGALMSARRFASDDDDLPDDAAGGDAPGDDDSPAGEKPRDDSNAS